LEKAHALIMKLFGASGIPWGLWMQLGFKSWKPGSIFSTFMLDNAEVL